MKIVPYKGNGAHPWRWRLKSKNGKITGDSAEGYVSRANVMRAIRSLAVAFKKDGLTVQVN